MGSERLLVLFRIRTLHSAAFWDILQVLLLCYLSIVLPLRACFTVDIDVGDAAFYFEVFVDVIFITDLLLNFRTAYMTPSGVLEERPRKIAKHYLKGWFTFDFLSCMPFQYLVKGGEGDVGKAAKALRLVRLAKMLRLARLKRIIGQRMGSRYGLVSEVSGFFVLFLIIVYVGHLLACFWYYVGTANDAPTTLGDGIPHMSQGWVQREYCCLNGEAAGECEGMSCSTSQFANVPLGQRYISSLYYVFNALERAYTQAERGYAVFAELCVGFIFGSLAGLMSSLMITLRGNEVCSPHLVINHSPHTWDPTINSPPQLHSNGDHIWDLI